MAETETLDTPTCFACGQPFKDGDAVYEDINEGTIHAACCGPDPESYVGADGEPLKPGDPIPEPWIWRLPSAEQPPPASPEHLTDLPCDKGMIPMAETNTITRDDVPAVYGIIDPDYARVFTVARCIAWSEGYALLMHGSFTRDLDLLAVPWAERAADAEHLVKRITLALDDLSLLIKDPDAPSQATEKPHGRRSWTLTFKAFGDPRFIDLGVMPRADAALAQREAARGE